MLPDETNDAIHRMWRLRIAFVSVALIAIAAVATLMNLAYSGGWTVPAAMWLGAACSVMAFRSVPRGVRPEEGPAMGRTAAWTVATIVIFFVVPVVLFRAGLAE